MRGCLELEMGVTEVSTNVYNYSDEENIPMV